MWFNHMVKQVTAQALSSPRAADDYPATPPHALPRPALLHRWSDLSLVHWPFEPSEVQALLPRPLEVDVLEGAAWVGLVPFHCTIHPPWIPRVRWVSSFEEINVRTYVRGPDGVPGVWFISLDAARLGAVAIARARWGLNYFWSKMAFARVGDIVTYSSRRTRRGQSRAVAALALEVGPRIEPSDMTPLDHFLTARWTFYGSLHGRVYRGQITHDPWRLHRARLLHCDPGLVENCGVPVPDGDPIVHHAEALDVRMSGRLPLRA